MYYFPSDLLMQFAAGAGSTCLMPHTPAAGMAL